MLQTLRARLRAKSARRGLGQVQHTLGPPFDSLFDDSAFGLPVHARQCVNSENATGTWSTPYIPEYPGRDRFTGRQLHTRDFRTADEFAGQHVVIVGGGISAIQLLDEISMVTTTTWVTRRPPQWRTGPFDEAGARAAVAIVEDRVRRGLPPLSVVSVTGLPVTPRVEAMRERGVLARLPMFEEIRGRSALDDGTSAT